MTYILLTGIHGGTVMINLDRIAAIEEHKENLIVDVNLDNGETYQVQGPFVSVMRAIREVTNWTST